jgi:cytoskeletal protein CcmA (bactofilin family)
MGVFGGKSNKPSPIDSLIGAGTTVNGDLVFSGGLRIDGVVKGNIRAMGDKPGTLVLSEMAKIEGEIDVGHVVVNGSVAGPIRANEYLELLPKARVAGDVTYKTIEIHVGAIVMGRMIHENDVKGAEKILEFKPAASN